jgi:hypothetical protein
MRTLLGAFILFWTVTAYASTDARALFDRIKSLEGQWRGRSTKGWVDTRSVKVIAAGSVVMVTSFESHPGETMATMFHLDGDRVLLTHYCVARNQPRLVATSYDAAAGKAVFEYLDGTGMASRDKGHMDKMIMTFDGSDRYRSRWTWFQDGTEKWMEDIENIRLKAAP